MFKNYFIIALRNIGKSKVFSFINIAGLAAGIASCILIFLYVANDLSFDKFHGSYENIYRINQRFTREDVTKEPFSITPQGFGIAMVNEYPGVKSVRMSPAGMYEPVISYNNVPVTSSDFIFADDTFFSFFNFPLLSGNPETALTDPSSIVITKSIAEKIFGNEDPLGKIVRMDNKYDLKVTGVAEDVPGNSSIRFKYVAAMNLLADMWGASSIEQFNNNFDGSNFYTFVSLPDACTPQQLEANLPAFIDKYRRADSHKFVTLFLQPLKDIHFETGLRFDFPSTTKIYYDYLLSAIALFILIIACINFINITTALAAARLKEIGLRKVLGANRLRIVWQFVTENFFITFIAIALAAVMAQLVLPYFNNLVSKDLSLNPLTIGGVLTAFIALWFLVVFITSAYPAVYMSSFQPVSILKGTMRTGRKGRTLRRSLIVFQFVVAVFLITMTVIVTQQYNYMKNSKLGFNKEQVLFIPSNQEISANYEAFKNSLLQNPGIKVVARANWIPGNPHDVEGYTWTGETGPVRDGFYTLVVDEDYAPALELEFAAGRNFSKETPSDLKDGFIVNEAAVRRMGWTNEAAVGQSLRLGTQNDRTIVGVLKDFNFKSLHEKIEPVVMLLGSQYMFQKIVIKTGSADINKTLNAIGQQWKTFSPDFPYDYHFVDRDFEELYMSEQKLSAVITLFSILSILIVCLGLLGLVSHSTRERTKEIGVRKVLGSSVSSVVFMLIKEYTGIILIANLIAWPLAFYVINEWLQNFAYKTEINWWVFLLSGGLAFIIAFAAVAYHSIKAARANPVESLKYE